MKEQKHQLGQELQSGGRVLVHNLSSSQTFVEVMFPRL